MTDRMLRQSYCPTELCDQIDVTGTVTPGTFNNNPAPGGLVNLSNKSPGSAIGMREYIYK